MTITAKSYCYLVYQGDDEGDQVADGPIFWARCTETKDIGHGDTQVEALEACMEAVSGRLEHYEENNVPIPPIGGLIND